MMIRVRIPNPKNLPFLSLSLPHNSQTVKKSWSHRARIPGFTGMAAMAAITGIAGSVAMKYLRSGLTGTSEKLVIFIRSFTGFSLYVADLYANSDLELDLESEENYSLIKPRIQNRLPLPGRNWQIAIEFKEWEGCVVNSTLYMFQQFTSKWDYTDAELGQFFLNRRDKKEVRKFHLSSDFLNSDVSMLNSSDFLEPNETPIISQFESVAPMKWLKHSPVAVPTPDGAKILVFDSVIEHERAHTCFELYHPKYNTWTPVKPPAFPQSTSLESLFTVRAYAFKDESTICFSTLSYDSQEFQFTLDLNPDSQVFQFTLDLNPEDEDEDEDEDDDDEVKVKEKEKEKQNLFHNSYYRLFPDFHSITIGGPEPGPVTISPGMVYRHETGDVGRFKLSPVDNVSQPRLVRPKPFITLLYHHEHVYVDTLVSHLHYKEDKLDNMAYIVIDAFHTRLDTKTLDTTRFATLKYKVNDNLVCKSLSVFVV